MKKFTRVLIIFFLAILLLALIVTWVASYKYNEALNYLAEKKGVEPNEFLYLAEKPHGNFKIGNHSGFAVIDTGATGNSINIENVEKSYLTYVGDTNGKAIFYSYKSAIYMADEFYVLGRKAIDTAIQVSEHNKFNIIGSSEIFSRDRVLISKKGLFYDNEINAQINQLRKIPIKVSIDRGKNGNVLAVFYQLLIDDAPERVLLDTGISNLLTLTGSVGDDEKNGTTKIKYIGTAEGNKLVKTKSYQAKVQLGEITLQTEYLALNDWINPRAKFYLGSEILNYYSLYFDFKKYQFFLIELRK